MLQSRRNNFISGKNPDMFKSHDNLNISRDSYCVIEKSPIYSKYKEESKKYSKPLSSVQNSPSRISVTENVRTPYYANPKISTSQFGYMTPKKDLISSSPSSNQVEKKTYERRRIDDFKTQLDMITNKTAFKTKIDREGFNKSDIELTDKKRELKVYKQRVELLEEAREIEYKRNNIAEAKVFEYRRSVSRNSNKSIDTIKELDLDTTMLKANLLVSKKEMGSLKSENQELKDKLRKFEVKEFDYRTTAKKNEELKKNANYVNRDNQRLIEDLEKTKHISKKNDLDNIQITNTLKSEIEVLMLDKQKLTLDLHASGFNIQKQKVANEKIDEIDSENQKAENKQNILFEDFTDLQNEKAELVKEQDALNVKSEEEQNASNIKNQDLIKQNNTLKTICDSQEKVLKNTIDTLEEKFKEIEYLNTKFIDQTQNQQKPVTQLSTIPNIASPTLENVNDLSQSEVDRTQQSSLIVESFDQKLDTTYPKYQDVNDTTLIEDSLQVTQNKNDNAVVEDPLLAKLYYQCQKELTNKIEILIAEKSISDNRVQELSTKQDQANLDLSTKKSQKDCLEKTVSIQTKEIKTSKEMVTNLKQENEILTGMVQEKENSATEGLKNCDKDLKENSRDLNEDLENCKSAYETMESQLKQNEGEIATLNTKLRSYVKEINKIKEDKDTETGELFIENMRLKDNIKALQMNVYKEKMKQEKTMQDSEINKKKSENMYESQFNKKNPTSSFKYILNEVAINSKGKSGLLKSQNYLNNPIFVASSQNENIRLKKQVEMLEGSLDRMRKTNGKLESTITDKNKSISEKIRKIGSLKSGVILESNNMMESNYSPGSRSYNLLD